MMKYQSKKKQQQQKKQSEWEKQSKHLTLKELIALGLLECFLFKGS